MAKDWGKKDPNEVIDYGISFNEGQLAEGDTLATAVWVFIDQAGCTKSNEAITNGIAKVRISGGTAGLNMTIELTATTTNGEVLEERAKLRIRNTT